MRIIRLVRWVMVRRVVEVVNKPAEVHKIQRASKRRRFVGFVSVRRRGQLKCKGLWHQLVAEIYKVEYASERGRIVGVGVGRRKG